MRLRWRGRLRSLGAADWGKLAALLEDRWKIECGNARASLRVRGAAMQVLGTGRARFRDLRSHRLSPKTKQDCQ